MIVIGEDFLLRRLEVEKALVENDDALDEGDLEMQAGVRHALAARNRIAEAQHDRLLGLRHGEHGAVHRQQSDDENGERDDRRDRISHFVAPSGAGALAALSVSSGR